MTEITKIQRLVCNEFNADFVSSPEDMKVGISRNVKQGVIPINGLRHSPEGDTTGWYIWGGEEFSEEPDFFVPLHVAHLGEWCPDIKKYLSLPPGYRFLIAGDYVDVWFDESLLNI